MKHIKMLLLAALSTSALMAFVGIGTASATELLCAGGVVCPAGTKIAAKSEGKAKLTTTGGEVKVTECEIEIGAKTTNVGNATETVKGNVEALAFLNCEKEKAAVTILNKGSLEIHTEGANNNNNGTLTTTNTEITVEVGGLHCIYKTSNTTIGTLTGSATTKGEATIDINAALPRTAGRSGVFCGMTGTLTGSYKISEPNPLNVA